MAFYCNAMLLCTEFLEKQNHRKRSIISGSGFTKMMLLLSAPAPNHYSET
jgi:hypothetical protein